MSVFDATEQVRLLLHHAPVRGFGVSPLSIVARGCLTAWHTLGGEHRR
jgi:hypothetical protein